MRLSEQCLHHAVATSVVATTQIDGAESCLMQKLTLPLPKLKVHSWGHGAVMGPCIDQDSFWSVLCLSACNVLFLQVG